MECGVRGLLGALVVKRVEMVHGSGDDFAIIQNQPSMAHIAWVTETRNKTAVLSLLAQVVIFTLVLQCEVPLCFQSFKRFAFDYV